MFVSISIENINVEIELTGKNKQGHQNKIDKNYRHKEHWSRG